MSDSIDPYQSPRSDDRGAQRQIVEAGPEGAYRPWSRGRTYVVFILGMHAASFMMFAFHPVFPIFALAFGIPAVIIANREIDEIPESAGHPFIVWGRRTGLIGLIGGPIALLLWVLVVVIVLAVA